MEAHLKQMLEDVDMKPMDVHDVDLEAQGLTEITEADLKFLSQFKNCINLTLGENAIRKISGPFPALPQLAMLDMRQNELGADVLGCLTKLTNLQVLMLTHNSIKTLDKFSALKSLTKLHFLGLEGNPVAESIPDYRQKIFALLPDLQVIDFVDREGNALERPAASDAASDDGDEPVDLGAFYNGELSDDDEEEYEQGSEEEEDDDEQDEEEQLEEPPSKKSRK